MNKNLQVSQSMTIKLGNELPETKSFIPGIRRAPKRELNLSQHETELALKNALRYIPEELMDTDIDQKEVLKQSQLMSIKAIV